MELQAQMDMASVNSARNVNNAAERVARLGAATQPDMKQITTAAQEFEAVFISQMLEHMFAGTETNEMTGGGEAEDIYRSMMVDEYGKLMAKSGGFGIADHVTRQLVQAQVVQDARKEDAQKENELLLAKEPVGVKE